MSPRVCMSTRRQKGLKLKTTKKSNIKSHVSIRNHNCETLLVTDQRAESNVVLNVVLHFIHTVRSFLHTDLIIQLRRVVAEPDHTHTTWRFFTRETCGSSDSAYFSILRQTHTHTTCHLGLQERVDQSSHQLGL